MADDDSSSLSGSDRRKAFSQLLRRVAMTLLMALAVVTRWRSKVTPPMVLESLLSWQVRGLPVLTAGNHERAGRLVASMLKRCVIHRWRELSTFVRAADMQS